MRNLQLRLSNCWTKLLQSPGGLLSVARVTQWPHPVTASARSTLGYSCSKFWLPSNRQHRNLQPGYPVLSPRSWHVWMACLFSKTMSISKNGKKHWKTPNSCVITSLQNLISTNCMSLDGACSTVLLVPLQQYGTSM